MSSFALLFENFKLYIFTFFSLHKRWEWIFHFDISHTETVKNGRSEILIYFKSRLRDFVEVGESRDLETFQKCIFFIFESG